MLRALSLTLGQLGDRAIVRVVLKSLALTLLIFIALGLALVQGARWAAESHGWGQGGGMWAAVAATLGAIAATWLLFRAVAVPVIGFFADEVVAAIEKRHYPEAAAIAKPATIGVSLKLAVASVLRLIGLNVIALPVYAILIFTAIGPVIAFVIVNALLLGRDLGEMVAVRHLDPGAMKAWLGRTRGSRAVLGLIVTGLFLIPFVNLLAPIIGAGLATHLFHGRHPDAS